MSIESIAYNQNMQAAAQQANIAQQSVVSDNMKTSSQLNDNKSNLEGASKINEAAKEQITKEQLQAAVDDMNSVMSKYDESLRFGWNDRVDFLTVSLINKTTNETLSEFPSKRAISMREFFMNANKEFLSREAFFKDLSGFIFDQKN